MLFVREYTTKSLDRSSVSMVDKYNTRLDKVGELLVNLSSLIENLLSLIRDVRNTLGQCKQRVYDNLNQVKEVIKGNNITGTESTIAAIESALKAGDKAIERAEATLQGVKQEIECNESSTPTQTPENNCGEPCNEEAEVNDDCYLCNVSTTTISDDGTTTTTTCQYDFECQNNRACDEDMSSSNPRDTPVFDGCSLTVVINDTDGCNYTVTTDRRCNETSAIGDKVPATAEDNCTFACTHSTPCHESAMPHNCTYACDDNGCNYTGNDCAYVTICNESCDQTEAEIEACGNCGEGRGCGDWSEFCGEGGSSTSKGDEEDSEGCGDCGDCGNCGEGDGCGDWSEFCGE